MVKESSIKLAIVGLAAAGKTSILKTLQRSYHIGDSLPPTRNVERTQFKIFGQEGNIWDFGGQDQYRSTYLSKPEKFFSEIRYMYFIVDIQDTAHYPDAIDYFQAVYQNAHSLSKDLIVVVIYHKCDPPIIEKPEIKNGIESLTREFMKIAEGTDLLFYQTSIYDPPSVLEALSQPILGDTDLYNVMSMIFSNFAMDHGGLEYITLIIDDLFEAGSFRIKKGNEGFLAATVKFYQQFASLDSDANKKIQSFEFEAYKFVIIHGKADSYTFTLNIAYPVNIPGAPTEEDFDGLCTIVDEALQKNHPSIY